MRLSAVLCLCVIHGLSSGAKADAHVPRHRPTVIYEGRSTIPAQPFYQRIENRRGESAQTLPPPGAAAIALEDRLPFQPTLLRVGKPDIKEIKGLVTPLFVMGMDDVSLNWFYVAAPGLVGLGARGIVVQAPSKSAWLELKERAGAAGIDLMLMEGDSFARGYRIRTYPMVFVGSELAGQGAHE